MWSTKAKGDRLPIAKTRRLTGKRITVAGWAMALSTTIKSTLMQILPTILEIYTGCNNETKTSNGERCTIIRHNPRKLWPI